MAADRAAPQSARTTGGESEATMLPTDCHALRAYRGDMAGIEPLNRETERELAHHWRAGDRRAGERLVVACLPFVIGIALEYRRWGVPMEDIIQQGNLGLLRAAKKFDPDRGCRLATYAAYWIRAEIRDYVVRGYRVVRLGTTKSERRALRAYRKTRENDPSTLAAVSGMTAERAEWLLPLLAGRETSLDARSDEHGTISDRLAGAMPSPEEEATLHEHRGRARDAVGEALRNLTQRERVIVRERLMADEPRTLQELGAEFGVSKERVRQIEERLRDKLRSTLEGLRDEAA
ncbi:MAG: sigma-70 family RNA polymerase sigma factor [Myxococcota bacterium]|nr:sigma-70 family RNA polymerase sigma factor [Myxococcota bacterium]